jgi:hypothetical protein
MGSLMGIDPSIKSLPNAKVESPRTKMLTNAMLKECVRLSIKVFNTKLVEFLGDSCNTYMRLVRRVVCSGKWHAFTVQECRSPSRGIGNDL